jgi:hypothetical protein
LLWAEALYCGVGAGADGGVVGEVSRSVACEVRGGSGGRGGGRARRCGRGMYRELKQRVLEMLVLFVPRWK